MKVIGTRWIDSNKGGADKPDYRARLVGKEFNNGGRNDELWYMLSYPNMAARDTSWAAFTSDPDWQKVRADSEIDGPLLDHLENRILSPPDFTPVN